MGNQICTDQRPYSLEDIRRTKDEFPHRKALSEDGPLVLRSTQQAFDSFEHNIKAFRFRLVSAADAATIVASSRQVGNNESRSADAIVGQVVKRSNVVCQSVSLRDEVLVDPSCAYMVLHIKRTDARGSAGGGETTAAATRGDASSVVPDWAGESFAAFTPRGVGTPFGIDIAAVRWRERNAAERYRFEYSLHVYNGRASHQLVVAVATMHAFQLEKLLINDSEVLQRLFYGFNAAKANELSLPVHVGKIDFNDPRIDMALHRHTGPLMHVLQHHALLRNLLSVNLDVSATTSTESKTTIAADKPSSPLASTTKSSSSVRSLQQDEAAAVAATPSSQVSPLPPQQQQQAQPPVLQVAMAAVNRLQSLPSSVAAGGSGEAEVPGSDSSSSGARAPPRLNLTGLRPSTVAVTSSPHHPQQEASVTSSEQQAPPPQRQFGLNLQSIPRTTTTAVGAAKDDEEDDSAEVIDEVRETRNKIRKLKEQAPIATEVLPYLFVGGEEAAADKQQLLSKGITHVVNAAAHAIRNTYTDVFTYTSLYLCDSPDEPIFSLIPLVNRLIDETRLRGGKTFIHCHQGVSRSCSLVIGFVMWKLGLCYDQAYSFVRERRKVCSPNSGFYVSLLRWERQLASPSQHQCWSFVPYSKENTFPFVLREVLTPPEVLAITRGGATTTATGGSSSPLKPAQDIPAYVFDTRGAYGLLAPSPDAEEEGTVYLLRGTDCPMNYSAAAYAELEHYLKYGFYTGTGTKTTENNQGVSVTYTPTTYLRRRIVELSANNPKARGVASSALEWHPNVTFGRDTEMNALLTDDISQVLEQHLESQAHIESMASARKRNREGDAKQQPSAHDGAPAAAGGAVKAAWGSSPEARRSADRPTSDLSDNGSSSVTQNEERTRQQPRRTSPGLLHEDDSEPEEGTSSVQVFAFPFHDSSPIEDIIVVDDLQTDQGYAIVVRGYRGGGGALGRQHRVYLWLGEEFTKDEEALRSAFDASVSSGSLVDARITNRTLLQDVEREIVYEREEPSELLLAFA